MEDEPETIASSVKVDLVAVEPIPALGGAQRSSTVHFRCVSDKFGTVDLRIVVPNQNQYGSVEAYARERLYQFGRDLAEQADPALFVKGLG